MFEYFGKTFGTQRELFDYLKSNKSILIMSKKNKMKKADAISFNLPVSIDSTNTNKSANEKEDNELKDFNVKVVINTTMIRDSHKDVHINGLWKKSLSENKNIYLLQEHKMCFESVIAENVNAYTELINWKELGYNATGKTEALIFQCFVDAERNEYMAEQYAKERVKNHSVGMQYVKIELAMNSESRADVQEKAVWDKYINLIANKEECIADGYFWAVTEAKVIEGSAVLRGSNFVTPTLQIDIIEPSDDTQIDIETEDEPIIITQPKTLKSKLFNL